MPATDPVPLTSPSVHAAAWADRLREVDRTDPLDAFGARVPGSRVLAVVAHPDDETLAMGATLARLAAHGVLVRVLCLTAGEAALDHVDVDVPGLAERRRGELADAATALGVDGATCLGLPDGALAEHAGDARSEVAEALSTYGATAVATLWRDDPHPDHRTAGRAALGAARDLGVPVVELGLWATHWTDPADVFGRAQVRLLDADDDAARTARASALAGYRSQTEPLDPGLEPVLPGAVTAWSAEYEVRS